MNENQLTELTIEPSWLAPLGIAFARYDINTPQRQACFIGQCAYESEDFKVVEENLRYRADALLRMWPSRFTYDQSVAYAYNQEKIANRIYADRMGNGDEDSGDGWKYRGRGLIQLTGKNAYAACGTALGVDLLSAPDLAATPEYACLTAGWFWSSRNLNDLADGQCYEQMTRRINGGTLGLSDRIALIETALKVLT